MHATMKSTIMLSICLSIVVATMAVRALGEETTMPHGQEGGHERQRRNHDKRHNHTGSINEINTSVPIQENHHRNHTHSVENRTEVVGLIEKTHHRNHTHQHNKANSTVESELKTKSKEKREKKAKALKTETMNDGNTNATISLTAENDIHAHHNHKGRDKHKDNSTADAFPSNETSAGASETSTVNDTTVAATAASEATTFATKVVTPSSSTRTGGVGADPERQWKEDNELEEVLAAVEVEFEAKMQSEELMGQQMTNSATVFTVGITGVVGVVVQTFVHLLIV